MSRIVFRALRFGIALAILLAIGSWSQAQEPSGPFPWAVSSIDEKLRPFLDHREIAGAVTLAATADQVVHTSAIGKSDLASGDPMRLDSIFWIASMTKPITGTAVLMLQDEGKLSVDDLVEKHLPEFQNLKTKDGEPARLTIRHLLTHTSGMGEASPAEARGVKNLAGLIPLYVAKPVQFEPGTKWVYCQSGINTAARIVEVISGQSFDEFLNHRLFEPLGMKDTTFYLTEKQLPRLAKSYRRTDQGELVAAEIGLLGGRSATNRDRYPAANGGLFSTASDYARFCQMILNNGELDKKRYLKAESVKLMTTIQTGEIKTGFTPGNGWGLGWCVVKEPQGVSAALSPGSFGHGGAYGTQAWIDPKQKRIYILMVQRANFANSDNSDVRREFQSSAKAALIRLRWEKDIQAFEAQDRKSSPPVGQILFIGSSSTKLWKTLAVDFPNHTIINRGFGGSQIADSTRYVDRAIVPCKPRLIVLQAGGNDLNAGKTPEQVFEDFKAFVDKIRSKLPETRIAFCSINPAPVRWSQAENQKKTNQLIQDYIRSGKNLDYINLWDQFLGSDGQPREELFLKDRLHNNEAGYKIRAEVVRPHLTGFESQADPAKLPGKTSVWNGFEQHDFQVDGKPVLVVSPKQAASGRPWVWRGEFFGHRPEPDLALLNQGFHVVYMRIPDQFGSPQAVAHWNAFYKELTEKYGFAKKVALIGMSRGGLYCYNWASQNPEKTACIYADAPVCDLKSWPLGQGKGTGNKNEIPKLLKAYGVATEKELWTKALNPIDLLEPLAKAKVPLLHVYGDADQGVPWEENTKIIADRYRKLGGEITLIAKPGVGHVHGLDDPSPIVKFIVKHSNR